MRSSRAFLISWITQRWFESAILPYRPLPFWLGVDAQKGPIRGEDRDLSH
jgi:hypothetical protein